MAARRREVPVALPGVAHIRVMYLVLVSLFIQEVEHILDGQRQGRASVRCAEDGLKQVIHKLLQRALQVGEVRETQGTTGSSSPPGWPGKPVVLPPHPCRLPTQAYLGGQEPCQVDLRDHLAAAVTLTLV